MNEPQRIDGFLIPTNSPYSLARYNIQSQRLDQTCSSQLVRKNLTYASKVAMPRKNTSNSLGLPPFTPLSQQEQVNPNCLAEIEAYATRSPKARLEEARERARFDASGKLTAKILRPRNAYVLYRQTYALQCGAFLEKQNLSTWNGANRGCVFSESWKSEPEATTAIFYRLAEKDTEMHQEAFPRYAYRRKEKRPFVAFAKDGRTRVFFETPPPDRAPNRAPKPARKRSHPNVRTGQFVKKPVTPQAVSIPSSDPSIPKSANYLAGEENTGSYRDPPIPKQAEGETCPSLHYGWPYYNSAPGQHLAQPLMPVNGYGIPKLPPQPSLAYPPYSHHQPEIEHPGYPHAPLEPSTSSGAGYGLGYVGWDLINFNGGIHKPDHTPFQPGTQEPFMGLDPGTGTSLGYGERDLVGFNDGMNEPDAAPVQSAIDQSFIGLEAGTETLLAPSHESWPSDSLGYYSPLDSF